MKTTLRLAALGLSLILAGCVTTSGGKDFDPATVRNFHEGQTTQAQVIQSLGQPQIKTEGEDGPGTSTWTYAFGSTTSDPKAYIPVVGGYLGSKANSSQKSLALVFDSHGVLLRMSQREENF